MRTLSPRERRLVALLILCALLGILWLAVIAPVVAGFAERSDRRSELRQQYQANQRMIGSIPRLRRLAERQKDDLRNFVVRAPTSSAASALLQERLQRTIEAAGGDVRAIDDAATTDRLLRVRASTRMTLAQMGAMLLRLQNEPPYLTIEALNVTADAALVSGHLETMEVSVEVSVPAILAKSR